MAKVKYYKLEFSRVQLELLEKLVDAEIAAHESGLLSENPQLLKRTFDVLWAHLQPSPQEKQRRFESWVRMVVKPQSLMPINSSQVKAS